MCRICRGARRSRRAAAVCGNARRRASVAWYLNPFPFLLSSEDNRVWRSPALARTAARDHALATGPVGMIDLTILRSIGCRLDV